MPKVLIIGAGGVGTVVAHKISKVPEVFTDIMLASRTKSKCDAIAEAVGANTIKTAQVEHRIWVDELSPWVIENHFVEIIYYLMWSYLV